MRVKVGNTSMPLVSPEESPAARKRWPDLLPCLCAHDGQGPPVGAGFPPFAPDWAVVGRVGLLGRPELEIRFRFVLF
jgi:hypothetical protein